MQAWSFEVSTTTIANCWLKSCVLGPKYAPITEQEAIRTGWKATVDKDDEDYNTMILQMDSTIQGLEDNTRIDKAMRIQNFLNPADEVVDDTDEDPINSITKVYDRQERVEETDEEVEEIPKIQTPEALKALQYLRLYEEQQEDGDSEVIKRLSRYEREIKERVTKALVQSSIESYYM